MRALRIHEQLNAAIASTGWSLADVLTKSGLKINRASLWRKLTGKLPLKTKEAEVITETLRRNGVSFTLVWPAAKRAA